MFSTFLNYLFLPCGNAGAANPAQVAGYERAEQPWYICHECDADWKNDMEMFRVCVACARNCHKGRLGHRTRFCKLSNTRCMCCERGEGCCLYFSKKVGNG